VLFQIGDLFLYLILQIVGVPGIFVHCVFDMIAQGERVAPGALLASEFSGMSEGQGCYTNDKGEIRATLNGVVKHEAIVVGGQGSEEEEHAHRVHVLQASAEMAMASSGAAYETIVMKDVSPQVSLEEL